MTEKECKNKLQNLKVFKGTFDVVKIQIKILPEILFKVMNNLRKEKNMDFVYTPLINQLNTFFVTRIS